MKRKRRLIGLGVLIFVVLAALIVLFGFRVHKLSVVGNSHHSAEEIADDLMTNFLTENTLYLLWKYNGEKAPEALPYLDSLRVVMKSPIRIEAEVSEKPLVAYVEDGENVYFDADGIVLEVTRERYENLPLVSGLSLGDVVLYQKLPTESNFQLRTILNLLDLLEYYDLDAEEISLREDGEISMDIRHIEVRLGLDEYLEEKVANLNAVLDNISASTAGILHLENVTGKYEDITFTPTGEVQEETEEETEAKAGSGSGEVETVDHDMTLGGTTMDGRASDSGKKEREEAPAQEEEAGEQEDAQEEEAGEQEDAQEKEDSDGDSSVGAGIMVFNSYGQLVYNVYVENGMVVDEYGSEVPGCTVNEEGYVVDAYMNIIDPATGDLMN